MAQIKIYGFKPHLADAKAALSEAIHSALMEAFNYPAEKRFQRFIALDKEEFVFPGDRSEHYLILEIIMFTGRSVEAKKQLIALLYKNFQALGIGANDLEIVMLESPRHNWGIRGLPGDELALNYPVNV